MYTCLFTNIYTLTNIYPTPTFTYNDELLPIHLPNYVDTHIKHTFFIPLVARENPVTRNILWRYQYVDVGRKTIDNHFSILHATSHPHSYLSCPVCPFLSCIFMVSGYLPTCLPTFIHTYVHTVHT